MMMRVISVGDQAVNSASSECGGEYTLAFLTSPPAFGFTGTEGFTGTGENGRFDGLGDLGASVIASALASMSRSIGRGSVSAATPAATSAIAGV
jgi:hypothetical protein